MQTLPLIIIKFLLIKCCRQNDGTAKWYKFDDGDVTECKMEEEEEMKSQCFGGDYLGEVFDHMLKRMSYRKQKRWWNAYMLFYTRLDVEENSLMKSVNELSLCKYILSKPRKISLSEREHAILSFVLFRYETRSYENATSDRVQCAKAKYKIYAQQKSI